MLGVDPGTKRIGLALSDELGLLASPLEVWTRRSPAADVAHVVEVARSRDVVAIVVGVPYRLDGSRGPAADKALALVAELRAAIPEVPVLERDEALTTYEAEKQLAARGLGPLERRGVIDAYAAAVILQEELDARAPRPRSLVGDDLDDPDEP